MRKNFKRERLKALANAKPTSAKPTNANSANGPPIRFGWSYAP